MVYNELFKNVSVHFKQTFMIFWKYSKLFFKCIIQNFWAKYAMKKPKLNVMIYIRVVANSRSSSILNNFISIHVDFFFIKSSQDTLI